MKIVAEQFKFLREVNSSSALLIVLLQVYGNKYAKDQLIDFSHYLQPQLTSQHGDISNGGTLSRTDERIQNTCGEKNKLVEETDLYTITTDKT